MVSLMGLNSSLSRLISSWTNLETSLGAIARLRDFVRDTPREDSVDTQSLPPVPQGWPSPGAIDFKSIDARYKYVPPSHAVHLVKGFGANYCEGPMTRMFSANFP